MPAALPAALSPIRSSPSMRARRPVAPASPLAVALRTAAPRLVAALYAHADAQHAGAPAWRALFHLHADDATQRDVLAERGAALATMVGAPVEGAEAQRGAILAAQTAVALVARLVALRVTERLDPAARTLAALAEAPDAGLLAALADTDRTLAARGVPGILDGDPFGWFAGAAPSDDLPAAVRAVVATIATLPNPTGADAIDLFAPLTQALVPGPVRHALGEFYTPPWLAEVVVDGALSHARGPSEVPAAWRGLDPCCGSGVFLLALARRVLRETAALPPAERVRAVLGRVAGLDLHPLAVQTARVNLLVVIAPLLVPGDEVHLPVLLGDATAGDPRGLGRFTAIVGNPPWVDWKRLPPAQRATLRESAVARGLYSGDGLVGGVSLNVCAVVAQAAADTWLADRGVLGLLMPRTLAVQPAYAAFRAMRRGDGGARRVVAFDDWAGVGHPFAPVTEPFLTWYVAQGQGSEEPADACVPVTCYQGCVPTDTAPLERRARVAGAVGAGGGYTWAADRAELARFERIAGECGYIGREGVEFYPQEVWLFEVLGPAAGGRVRVRNYQGGRSRYRVPARELELEAAWLHPLVKGVDIGRFGVVPSGLVVPFPYRPGERLPVPMAALREEAPALAAWLAEHAPLLAAQTPYNARIIGRPGAEAHALARVGRYSFARAWVAFRDNTTWGASVVTDVHTAWGGPRAPRFQNHAVSMCERADGALLGEDEAHYVCAVLNAPIVARFLGASSDTRSFKIRPPVRVPPYDDSDLRHRALTMLSREAHAGRVVDRLLDAAYLAVLEDPAP